MKNVLKKCVIISLLLMFVSVGAGYCDTNQELNSITRITKKLDLRKPTPKRKLALKFIMAMLGVGASSVAIFVMLSLYNKLMYGAIKPNKRNVSDEDNDFRTSTNMKEALNIFLKKTK